MRRTTGESSSAALLSSEWLFVASVIGATLPNSFGNAPGMIFSGGRAGDEKYAGTGLSLTDLFVIMTP